MSLLRCYLTLQIYPILKQDGGKILFLVTATLSIEFNKCQKILSLVFFSWSHGVSFHLPTSISYRLKYRSNRCYTSRR